MTSRDVHCTIVRPVVDELRKRYWKVMILRFERIWEIVEFSIEDNEETFVGILLCGGSAEKREENKVACIQFDCEAHPFSTECI